jgi:hypothetical protein
VIDLIFLAETIAARSQMGNNPQMVAIADTL